MQKLEDDMRKIFDTDTPPDHSQAADADFVQLAQDWSNWCLANLYGDLLDRGMKISQALVNFDIGLKHPEKLAD